MEKKLSELTTEKVNRNTLQIDKLETLGIVKLINEEDKKVANAVENELLHISKAVDIIADKLEGKKGRLIYIGAGTSGRLGVLDASECPPTFNTPKGMVQGLIAGGDYALRNAVEHSEDIEKNGELDLKEIQFSNNDVLVGIASSGRTPYVIGALKYAQSIGAKTISLACNKDSLISEYSDVQIEVIVGPEAVTGSTRMKAGTAQKMVLNMLTTSTMIKLGKTYKNYMIDVQPTNEKLKIRAANILNELTGISKEEAVKILENTNYNVKLSLVMIKGNTDKEKAEKVLEISGGKVSKALELLTSEG